MVAPITRRFSFRGLVLAAAYLTMPLWTRDIRPGAYPGATADADESRALRNRNAVAQLFGEFRVGMSDLMFIKTDIYLHGGVDYTSSIDLDKMARTREIAHMGDDRDSQTRIPAPNQDWRGWIGNLEREVKPWVDARHHPEHRGGRELLPWYWLATQADPHNLRAYRVGAYWLSTIKDTPELARQAEEEALKFVDSGIQHNPRAFVLYKVRGETLRRLDRLEEALAAFTQATRLGLSQRPREGWGATAGAAAQDWDDDREEELAASMRFQVLILEQLQRYDEALRTLELFHRVFPQDGTLRQTEQRIKDRLAGKVVEDARPDEWPGVKAMEDEHEHEHEQGRK